MTEKILKIGIIIPSSNTTMEPEFWSMSSMLAKKTEEEKDKKTDRTILLPLFARMPLTEVSIKALEVMEKESIAEAEKLAHAKVDLICYGCTSGSFIGGKKTSEEITNRLKEKTNIPTYTTAQALVEYTKKLNVTSLTVITPYTEKINEREKIFLEGMGVKVNQIIGMGIKENIKIGEIKPRKLEDFIRRSSVTDSDALFLSCTNMPTMRSLEKLSKEYDRPVYSSNSASFWYGIQLLGLTEQARKSKIKDLFDKEN